MIRLRIITFVITVFSVTHVAPVVAAESAAELIEKLASDQPQDIRVAAATALQEKSLKAEERKTVISILTPWLKDKDPEVRKSGIILLTCLMIGTKGRCPLEVAETMFDDSPDVRLHAAICVSECRNFPAEALPLLFRAIEHDDTDVRCHIPVLLAQALKDDKRTIPALKKATTDKDALVKNSAFVALFQVTDDFDLVVPYHLRTLENSRTLMLDVKEEDYEREFKKRQAGLAYILRNSSDKFLVEHGETEPEKLGRCLVKLLSDKSPTIRRAAVRALGEIAEHKQESKEALRRINAQNAIEKLADDREITVGGAALRALDQLNEP